MLDAIAEELGPSRLEFEFCYLMLLQWLLALILELIKDVIT